MPQIKELLADKNDIEFVLVETDRKDGFNMAIDNNVFSLPTLIAYENEKEIKRLISNFTIDDVKALIGA